MPVENDVEEVHGERVVVSFQSVVPRAPVSPPCTPSHPVHTVTPVTGRVRCPTQGLPPSESQVGTDYG